MKKRLITLPMLLLAVLVITFSCSKSEPKPTASFDVQGNYFMAPATIIFSNNSFDADDYEWEFGDGNTSTEANPTHTYEEPGSFSARLTATNAEGNTDVETYRITVYGELISWAPSSIRMMKGAYEDLYSVEDGQEQSFYLLLRDAQGNQVDYMADGEPGQVRSHTVNENFPETVWNIAPDFDLSIANGQFTFAFYHIDEDATYYDPDTDFMIFSKTVKITDIATEDNGPFLPEISDAENQVYSVNIRYKEAE